MGNLGMRVSQEDIDVKTGADKDMVFTSKYSVLKGSITGTGTVSVERDGTEEIVTIPHGLGYIPMVDASFSDVDGVILVSGEYYKMPTYLFFGTVEGLFTAYADSTNVYLKFVINDL